MAHLRTVSLDDKYRLQSGQAFMTGLQALVRLPMMQHARDQKAGLKTAGFISGYRGSPLGGLDQMLWRARDQLDAHNITFQPGLNEDLAATAIWGTQQIGLFPGARADGVFAYWYGKGPGLDRSGDVLKHANNAGTAPRGGVLLLVGDDHAAKSSTAAHQCEYSLMDAHIPVLHPAGIGELLDYGLLGIALSRASGCWVGMKVIAETADSSAPLDLDPHRLILHPVPADAQPQAQDDGVHIRWPDTPLEQERRLIDRKLPMALAFARANHIDRVILDSPTPRLGLVTTGKAYLDVRQALEDLGITPDEAARIGLRLYKVGMPWPLEPMGIRAFAQGLDEILVIEEKRPVIEAQLKEHLYDLPSDRRPMIVGKQAENGAPLVPTAGELTPARLARIIAGRLNRFVTSRSIEERLTWLDRKESQLAAPAVSIARKPYYCAGCPHNTSTTVPEGSRALAGIGCHFMVTWMPERRTETLSQMGGEGAAWIGQAPYSKDRHVFVNLGDGTYNHSGLLAIRAAVAAGVTVTYKLLYNDAVAMTGGQPVDGAPTPAQIARQLEAIGVSPVIVVAEDPDRYPIGTDFGPGTTIRPREDFEQVQREIREYAGVSAILYDQTCAAEKRRRRKRGTLPQPPETILINDLVCEGCGDCGSQSNCVAIAPLETEWGRKRTIDQSACNTDQSCLKGFCPSFVTVTGVRRRTPDPVRDPWPTDAMAPHDRRPPALTDPFSIVITGIGGTGVVTTGAILGMAAHLDGIGVTVLDQIGLAQKNGAVVTHVRFGPTQESLHAVRIAAGNADLLLGCDALTAGGFDVLAKIRPRRTDAVINSHQVMPADFTQNPDLAYPDTELIRTLRETTRHTDFIDATRATDALLAAPQTANLFMIGYAWQQGRLPLSCAAIEQAITLNGVAVTANKAAFLWGRRAAGAPDLFASILASVSAAGGSGASTPPARTLDEIITRRVAFLIDYQDVTYAQRYRERIAPFRELGHDPLTEAVAKSYFKLLAYKDEYEVARLWSDGRFQTRLRDAYDGKARLQFHLAPPLLGGMDPNTGRPRKRRFGPWIMPVFRLLATLKGLRGTALDPFGWTAERRLQRQLIREFETTLTHLRQGLDQTSSPDRLALATKLAALPQEMRGFGPVFERAVTEVRAKQTGLMAQWDGQPPSGQSDPDAPAFRHAAE